MAKVNFLSNKELLHEIHLSKNSYCYYIDKTYSSYDAIVLDLSEVTVELIEEARVKRANAKFQAAKQVLKNQGYKAHQIKVDVVGIEEIPVDSIVIRVMTTDHIPLLPEEELKPAQKARKEEENRVKTNFNPFKHYQLNYDGDVTTTTVDMSKVTFKEVGRSHWKNGLDNGYFCMDHGNITDRLARMYLKLVDRYSQKPNWRGYSYLDEMKNQSLLQLIQVGLKFDERRSQNPFAYYTTTMTNSFTGVFHKEKRNQNIRDDILIMQGQTPSNTRMVEHEMSQK
ncbi:hypothetical protein D3C87_628310 [compost metagenome]